MSHADGSSALDYLSLDHRILKPLHEKFTRLNQMALPGVGVVAAIAYPSRPTESKVVMVNDVMTDIVGWSAHDLITSPGSLSLPPTHLERVITSYKERLHDLSSGNGNGCIDIQHIHRDAGTTDTTSMCAFTFDSRDFRGAVSLVARRSGRRQSILQEYADSVRGAMVSEAPRYHTLSDFVQMPQGHHVGNGSGALDVIQELYHQAWTLMSVAAQAEDKQLIVGVEKRLLEISNSLNKSNQNGDSCKEKEDNLLYFPVGSMEKVLVISDSEPKGWALRDTLIGGGYEAHIANSSLEVKEKLRTRVPFKVVLFEDAHISHQAPETLKFIQSRSPKPSIIKLTHHSSSRPGYIRKPVKPLKLLSAIRQGVLSFQMNAIKNRSFFS